MDEIKLYGPPGCGKTTAGVEWMADQAAAGAAVEGLAYVSFTNAAADEARERVVKRLQERGQDVYAWEVPLCATLHALCKRALRIEGQDWLADRKLKEFGEAYDYSVTRSVRMDSEDEEEIAKQGGEDAVLLSIWDFGRQRLRTDADRAYDAYVEYDADAAYRIDSERFGEFVSDYEQWKQETDRRDFTDLLSEVAEKRVSLPASAVVVDEAQDQTPLLWAAADSLFAKAEVRACMGDPDQAIYSFQGCAPELLYSRPSRQELRLEQSHRLPRAVWELARQVIRQNEGRIDVPFAPCTAADVEKRHQRAATTADLQGEVGRIGWLDEADLNGGESWMLLVRNWCFVPQLTAYLEENGLLYTVAGENYYTPWSDRGPFQAAKVLLALSTPGVKVTLGALAPFLEKTRVGTRDVPGAWIYGAKSRLKERLELNPEERVGLMDLPPLGLTEWGFDRIALRDFAVLGGVSERDLTAYTASLKQGTWGQVPRVLVSTIHGVKGGEADRVIALESATRAPLRNLIDAKRRAEEVRLAYVAITRARRGFYVCEHQDQMGGPYDVFEI